MNAQAPPIGQEEQGGFRKVADSLSQKGRDSRNRPFVKKEPETGKHVVPPEML